MNTHPCLIVAGLIGPGSDGRQKYPGYSFPDLSKNRRICWLIAAAVCTVPVTLQPLAVQHNSNIQPACLVRHIQMCATASLCGRATLQYSGRYLPNSRGRPANYLEVFDKIPGKPSGSKGCIDALGGEIVQLLEVGIHHNLLLIGVLEGLHSWQLTILTCSQCVQTGVSVGRCRVSRIGVIPLVARHLRLDSIIKKCLKTPFQSCRIEVPSSHSMHGLQHSAATKWSSSVAL